MENFGNKYLVKSNNTIKVIHRLHYNYLIGAIPIQDWFERGGRLLLNLSRASYESITTTVDLSDSLT